MMCNSAVFWQTGLILGVFFAESENLDFTGFSGGRVRKRSPIWAYFKGSHTTRKSATKSGEFMRNIDIISEVPSYSNNLVL